MPLVHASRPREEMQQIAIEEWMAASPVYSLRTQRALDFARRRRADDPQEHPARHRRAAPLHGLPLPGRRRGARRVLARALRRAHGRRADGRGVRAGHVPRHRGPDLRRDRGRDEPARAGAAGAPPAARAGRPRAALPLDDRDRRRRRTRSRAPEPSRSSSSRVIAEHRRRAPDGDAEPGGWADYSGEFDPDFELEDLSHSALVVALQEFAVQSHLLFRGFLLAVAQHYGDAEAARDQPAGLHRARRAHRAAAARPRWASTATTRRDREAAAGAPGVLSAHVRRPLGRGASTTTACGSRSVAAPPSRRATASRGSRSSAARPTVRSTRSCRP